MSSLTSSVSTTHQFRNSKCVPLHLALYVGTGNPHSVFMLVQCIRLSILLHWATSPAPWKSRVTKPWWRTRGKARRIVFACCPNQCELICAAVLLCPENTPLLVIYPFWLFQFFPPAPSSPKISWAWGRVMCYGVPTQSQTLPVSYSVCWPVVCGGEVLWVNPHLQCHSSRKLLWWIWWDPRIYG